MFESNVHFPTDLNLAFDAARKSIDLSQYLADELEVKGWRKAKNWKTKLKSSYLKVTNIKNGGGKNKTQRLEQAVKNYLKQLKEIELKTTESITEFSSKAHTPSQMFKLDDLNYFHKHNTKHIDLITRRLLKNESIPHEEKVFSLFEPHTEWISKGKLHKKVELGHRLLITTDQNNLIVDYQVLENEVDVQSVTKLVDRLKKKFGEKGVASHSFDKGFYSKENKLKVGELAEKVIMPKRGKCNKEEQEEESAKPFKKLRNKHSAIESNINELEHHGLDKCPDKGLDNYKRYVGLGVASFNLAKIGTTLTKEDKAKAKALEKRAA